MLIARVIRSATLLTLVPVLLPAALVAQGRMGGMGRGGGRGPGNIAREEGLAVQRPVNAVNLLIEHRQELTLTDSQFMRVIVVKRGLDSANAPLMRRIDSVQHVLKGGAPLFGETSPARRDSLSIGRSVVQQTLAGVRDNNAEWRDKAYALLSGAQVTKAQELEAKAEKELEDALEKGRGRGSKP
jgi:hypothetical protein